MDDKRTLSAVFAAIDDIWRPRRIASVNDYDVRAVKVQGEFVWHEHPETDEFFLVTEGELTIQLRDRDVVLGAGDFFVVPAGTEHCPKADALTSAILIEPRDTVNTGTAGGERTAVPIDVA